MYLRPSAPGLPRIIVVDQDSFALSRLCGLIQSKGYAAMGVETAPGACRMVHRHRFDLILTTMTLPEADRRAWSASLARLDSSVPVVAMCEASSVHALDLFDAANEFGAVAVLRRPFTASTLLQILAELLPVQAKIAPASRHSPAPIDWPGLASASTAIH